MKGRNILLFLSIILGLILWQTKNVKEGLSSAEAEALGNDINNYASSKLSAAGIDPNARQADITSVFNQMASLIENEKDDMAKNTYEANPVKNEDDMKLDTTAEKCLDKTFLTGKTFSDGFCQSNYNSPLVMNQQCNRLTADNCNATACCILMDGNKCMAGSAAGPKFTPDRDYTYYMYKYRRYNIS